MVVLRDHCQLPFSLSLYKRELSSSEIFQGLQTPQVLLSKGAPAGAPNPVHGPPRGSAHPEAGGWAEGLGVSCRATWEFKGFGPFQGGFGSFGEAEVGPEVYEAFMKSPLKP